MWASSQLLPQNFMINWSVTPISLLCLETDLASLIDELLRGVAMLSVLISSFFIGFSTHSNLTLAPTILMTINKMALLATFNPIYQCPSSWNTCFSWLLWHSTRFPFTSLTVPWYLPLLHHLYLIFKCWIQVSIMGPLPLYVLFRLSCVPKAAITYTTQCLLSNLRPDPIPHWDPNLYTKHSHQLLNLNISKVELVISSIK